MPTATADRAAFRLRRGPLAAFTQRAARRVPAGSTVCFRVAFGLLVTYSSGRFLLRGWVDEFYLSPEHHLTYPGLDWVQPWPAPWMQLHVLGLAVLGVLIACGVGTRVAAAMFAIGFTYVELIDRALYLNHYWFMTLAAVLLVVSPGPARSTPDEARSVPVVTVWALRAQVGAVYLFAGIAKLNPDWLLSGEPLHTWLAARTDRPLIGPLLDEPGVALGVSWMGVAFDLTIVAWLLWRRSRPWAYAVLVVFHVATAMLFQIGVFPWVMVALTPIFFEPDWPTRLRGRLGPADEPTEPTARDGPPNLGRPRVDPRNLGRPRVGRTLVVFLVAFALMNVALPLRHWFADGNVRWNDDGYELSWRVMLTDRSGFLEFEVSEPSSGEHWRVSPELVLTRWQAGEAESRPQLALHTADLVADHFAVLGHPDVEVRADSFVAMNGRLRQRMIDPDVDLASVSRWAPASAYVLPLDPPIRT